ncbi:unnamed protein product [Spodoptera littoralis]|uniref:dolichyl-phosphate-mannose--protein mannosyltransferase n=1 Tax=Spodoptera littoralis TaxID=7109 RepID=A0A9P0IEX4_SPOLI|nr:unnamed protein product [Spodoptera littoralis]CAH1646588.1 unnamed protein product [Spodoptera littoralis]
MYMNDKLKNKLESIHRFENEQSFIVRRSPFPPFEDYLILRAHRWRSVCALGTGGFALLYWRLRLAGAPTAFAAADNPASRDPSILTRLYTFAYLPVFNFFLLLYPFHLSFDWSMDSIPRITTLFDARNITTAVFYAVISKVTWRTLTNELKKHQDNILRDAKYYKKQNCKIKHKWNYSSKPYNRGQDCYERKSYHAPHKENVSSKKLLCPCTGCKHSLTDEHTSVCRASNNNNITMHNSSCICPISLTKSKASPVQRTVYRSPQVALLMFMAFMVLPFVPATNLLFYVGFVVAERVLYIPSVGFCLLLGLGAGVLTRNWHRGETRSRLFLLALLVALSAMCGYTMRRNLDWRDEESLFRSALHINPPKGARVSTQVASHTKDLPSFQGIMDIPSGLLPSSRAKPFGSRTAGTPAMIRARRIMSLMLACRAIRPALLLHDRPWWPRRVFETGQSQGASYYTNLSEQRTARRAYGNLGSVLTTQGRTAEAEVAFERALKYRPNMADVHYNLGILLQNQKRYSDAIKSFERAIYFRPSMALAYVNLGTSLMADGRLAEAASALRAGSRAEGVRVRDRREHDAARVSALVQLAALHSQRGHWHKALSAYKEALQILPDTNTPIVGWTRHSVLSMVGEIYVQLQQWPMAEHSLVSALAAAPHHAGTHVTLAQILARNASRSIEAEMWFKKALTLAPNDPSVRDQFGMFLRSQRRLRESAEQLVAAAQLSPTDSARAASAARALRDARRCRSAERWYARAVQLNPDDAEYHSNLGAILHLNGKYAAAATSYRRALQLQPNDDITITNLKRVRALMSKQRRK